MYARFFRLKQEPFAIAPDPRFLFMSERHREALAHLLYGVGGGGGFVLLTGEIGAGKTTVCRCFLEQIPRRSNVAYIFNPKLTVLELLKSVCEEFRIPYEHQGPGLPTVKDYIDPLNEFLLRTHAVGQNNVLIIDEAQNLSAEVLEQLRLLTNLETHERKLLQIVLIGQPELRDMLQRPDMEQLAQRVIARFHLGALSEDETAQYIRHRLSVAGMTSAIPFDGKAMRRVHQLSRGVPRRINLLCDRALLGAYAGGQSQVDSTIVETAAREVFDKAEFALPIRSGRPRAAVLGLSLVAGAAVLGVVTLAMDGGTPGEAAPQAADIVAAAPASAVADEAVAAEPAPPAGAQLRASLDRLSRNEEDAWRELAPAWKLALDDGDPCQAAQRQQVVCYKGNSTLALIRQLGRPGILTLLDDQRRPAYAVLVGLGEHDAVLRIGGEERTVALASLGDHWRGDFATFWRAPPGYRNAAGARDADTVAQWLALQLATLRGEAPPGDKPMADAALKQRIHSFQIAQGLVADGLAGPVTFMQINRATGVDEPRLHTPR